MRSDIGFSFSGFTIMLLFVAIGNVCAVDFHDRKKTRMVRGAIILVALVIYAMAAIICLQPIKANGNEIVYITRTGSKYHSAKCRHLAESQIEITLENAIVKGYDNCYHCTTPKYVPETIHRSFSDLYPPEGIQFMVYLSLGLALLFLVYIGLHAMLKKKK